jgi:hypothetical protein
MASLEDFDRLDGRKVAESIADWLDQHAGTPIPFERVDPATSESFRPANSASSTRCRPGSTANARSSALNRWGHSSRG